MRQHTNLALGGFRLVPRSLREPMYIRQVLDILGFRDFDRDVEQFHDVL